MDGFDKWKTGIDRASSEWDFYDFEITRVVFEYNFHLRETPQFRPLDWRLVKAMLWTESGPFRDEWKTRPMQIGVPPDPGLRALLFGNEGSELIVPPCFVLTPSVAANNPRMNIVAAVGYMLMRMANYGFATVTNDARIFEVTVGVGESLSTLARRHNSTIPTLQKLNPAVRVLRPGQVLNCQQAFVRKVVVGWRLFTFATVARRYNGNGEPSGDPLHAKKLEHAMAAIASRSRR